MCSTASNTSPSWQEPELLDVAGVADVAQDPAALEARDVERRRRREPRLWSRQPLQLKAETMLHRRQRLPRQGPTTRNCLFTLLRTEDQNSTNHGSVRQRRHR